MLDRFEKRSSQSDRGSQLPHAYAQARRRRREALLRSLQAAHERLWLHAKGAAECAAPEDDGTRQALQRHLLRGTGAEAVDLLLLYQEVPNPHVSPT